jgi:hypothetical protein
MIGIAMKRGVGSRTFEEVGTVTEAGEGEWTVQAGTGVYVARRALSCLLAPELGDEVLLALAEDGRAWILAVLERRAGAPLQLETEGDLAIRVKNGRFSISAQEGLDLATAKKASLISGELRVTSPEAVLQLDRASYIGRVLHGQVDRIKLFAQTFDSAVDRVWQRVKRSFRFVEEVDHVQAEEILYRAKNSALIQGQNALIGAEQLAKVDAGQIHLG